MKALLWFSYLAPGVSLVYGQYSVKLQCFATILSGIEELHFLCIFWLMPEENLSLSLERKPFQSLVQAWHIFEHAEYNCYNWVFVLCVQPHTPTEKKGRPLNTFWGDLAANTLHTAEVVHWSCTTWNTFDLFIPLFSSGVFPLVISEFTKVHGADEMLVSSAIGSSSAHLGLIPEPWGGRLLPLELCGWWSLGPPRKNRKET